MVTTWSLGIWGTISLMPLIKKMYLFVSYSEILITSFVIQSFGKQAYHYACLLEAFIASRMGSEILNGTKSIISRLQLQVLAYEAYVVLMIFSFCQRSVVRTSPYLLSSQLPQQYVSLAWN